MADARKPLMAGNWKMNLNHLEAIALTQKLGLALKQDDFDAVDVAVIPPFTDLRSVQTLVDGERLGVKYGAQDLSAHDAGAYTGEISVRYKAPTPLNTPLVIRARLDRIEGRKLHLVAVMSEDRPDAPLIATSHALFIAIETY